MSDADDVNDAIADVAQNPKRIKGDEGEIEEHSLDDLIKAQKHLAGRTAVSGGKGFRLSKFKAPGADL